MIELIFVIVILGILAAVAVPKLAATRDDAKVAKGATELATLIGDFGSYYTSKGSFATAGEMSNVYAGNATDGAKDMNTSGTSVSYEGCITIVSVKSDAALPEADGVDVRYQHTGASNVCMGIAKAAAKITGVTDTGVDSNMTHIFGGSGVVW